MLSSSNSQTRRKSVTKSWTPCDENRGLRGSLSSRWWKKPITKVRIKNQANMTIRDHQSGAASFVVQWTGGYVRISDKCGQRRVHSICLHILQVVKRVILWYRTSQTTESHSEQWTCKCRLPWDSCQHECFLVLEGLVRGNDDLEVAMRTRHQGFQ